jgi:hypothetical protein
MAIFKRLSKKEIKENYTHYALAYGIYPVYIKGIFPCCDDDALSVAVRNWFPEWGLTALDWIVQTILSIRGKENLFMFRVTGEINK